MKKYLFLLISSVSFSAALGQKIEFAAQVNSGLSWFGGESATSRSFIIVSDVANQTNFTNHPYGKKPGTSYGFSGQVQRVTKRKLVLGLQAGYEVLKSKLAITDVSMDTYKLVLITDGETILRNEFTNWQFFVGKRLGRNNWKLDITAGPEVGFCQNSHEKGFAKSSDGYQFTTDLNRTHPKADWGARLHVAAYYQKIGLSLGYAHGLSNYQANLEGANLKTYARITRLGIVYRFN